MNKKLLKYHTPESSKTIQKPQNQQIYTTSKNPKNNKNTKNTKKH